MHLHFLHRGHRHAHRFGHRHRGFQGFGFGPGQLFNDEAGRGGVGAGRKLNAGDLQLLILALLAEKPSHGYEVIRSLDERSNGYYSPSPGMVYPALTYLEEIGHASVETLGTIGYGASDVADALPGARTRICRPDLAACRGRCDGC